MQQSDEHFKEPRKTFKTLKVVHLILVIGMFAFAVLTYFIQDNLRLDAMAGNSPAIYLIPVLGLAGYFGSQWVYRKLLSTIKSHHPLSQKLTRFQSASYLQYTCLEIPALLALLAYLYDGFILHLAIAAFLILYMYSRKPTVKKLNEALPLTAEELRLFE
ncbi:hypothetical protein PP178_08665 [Zeaxanthinibacter sp. PT1]|uniref:hypothetical protein n=1 Tax=Zeaxanthinibacter TaxID=561554 RepID=UPI00234A0B45|nr:hypothetical protein [Zeaxanthinibacter sp. PT1]MDC6351627.1 hypothetical protein [Zeaxanthinibacter sp. PT1]